MAKILLIDDDTDLASVISAWLTSESHSVEMVHAGSEAQDRLRLCQYDLVLLDWQLPEISGLEILRTFRNEKGSTPVIMLTGNKSVEDKSSGLDGGADDYLTKPFHMQELSSRIRAVLRRSTGATSNVLTVGGLVLDPAKHKVLKDAVEVTLLPREFALLEFLMRHPDTVFSSESLLQRVWHSDSEATVEAIRTCVKRLRQKIDQDDDHSVIQTVARIGYKLKVDP
jgi:DNA-binding response OmpR family regulator